MAAVVREVITTGIVTAIGSVVAVLVGAVIGYFVRKLLDARQVRYTRLYERRAEVIDQLHERLFEVGDALKVWGSVAGYREEQQREFEKLYDEFYRYYRAKSLWLDSLTRQKLDAFFKETRAVRHMIADLQEVRAPEEWNELQSGSERPLSKAEARAWVQEKTEKDLPELMGRLREDFREIIEISDLSDRDAPRPRWRRLFG